MYGDINEGLHEVRQAQLLAEDLCPCVQAPAFSPAFPHESEVFCGFVKGVFGECPTRLGCVGILSSFVGFCRHSGIGEENKPKRLSKSDAEQGLVKRLVYKEGY